MKNIDGEIGRLTINVEQLVDRLQLLQEENRTLKQKASTLTKQLAKLYAELGEAKETIKLLQENVQTTDGQEEVNNPFAPMTISFEEKLLIRHQLEHLLEQVNLELQRLS
jgi:chromosome segregation ATPase